MGPKKARTSGVAGSSGGRRKTIGSGGAIIFKDSKQKKRYESLSNVTLQPTRYPPLNHPYDTTLSSLGIKNNCITMYERLGWLNFLRRPWDTYPRLTLEFLSSFRFYENKTDSDILNHRLSFRMYNSDFNMSLGEFADILGFQNFGFIHDSKNPAFKPEGFNEKTFWGLITGQSRYEARAAKASRIHNPVFRYVHRTMAHTIFARAETGTVNSSEMFMLWSMVNSMPVYSCYYLVKHLAHLAEKKSGIINIGGIVSFIATKFDLGDFDESEGIGSLIIDYDYCCLINLIEPLIKHSQGESYLLISRQRSIILPDPDRTEITNPNNWLYPIAAEGNQPRDREEVQEDEDMPGPSSFHDQYSQNFDMEAWCIRIEEEQQRQGVELQRQGAELQLIREDQLHHSQQMEQMTDMLQSMMRHFNINQFPPPDHQ